MYTTNCSYSSLKIADYQFYVKSPLAIIGNFGKSVPMKIYLYAVKLPQAATLAITSYKRSLFKTRGCVSALAALPLIPLAWTQSFHRLPDAIPVPESWEVFDSQPAAIDGAWYLRCAPETEIESLKRKLAFPDLIPGLFPLSPGIHIASSHDLVHPPKYTGFERIDDIRLCVYEVFYTDPSLWFEDVMFRSVEQKHLR
jgi:hypothetical protein